MVFSIANRTEIRQFLLKKVKKSFRCQRHIVFHEGAFLILKIGTEVADGDQIRRGKRLFKKPAL